MIYVPDERYNCYVVYQEGVLRGYEQVPTYNSTIAYRDFYIDNNYIYRDGVQSFSNYSTLPICLDSSVLSTEYYYRNDFDSILIIFAIMAFFIIYLPLKVFSRLFRRKL